MSTPKNDLSEIAEAQSDKFLRYNSAIQDLDQLCNLTVVNVTTTIPGSPANGDAYIVAHGATGDWAGYDDWIAYWLDNTGAWKFKRPYEGWIAYNYTTQSYWSFEEGSAGGWSEGVYKFIKTSSDSEGSYLYHNGSDWVASTKTKIFAGEIDCDTTTVELFRVTLPAGGGMTFEGVIQGSDGLGNMRWFQNRGGYVDDGNSPNTISVVGSIGSNNGQTGGTTTGWTTAWTQDGNDIVLEGTSGSAMTWTWHVEVAVN